MIECPMGAVLNTQLQSVMQEGLLDSLLPYLVRDKKLYKVTITPHGSVNYLYYCSQQRQALRVILLVLDSFLSQL